MSDYPDQAKALYFDGNRHMEAGTFDDAERCFKAAISIAPDFAEALCNLGFLRERAGAFAEAETCYRQAIAADPHCIQTWLNLGVLLLNRKRFDEAEALDRQAVQQAPNSPACWSNLGVLLACLKREEEALHCYRIALGLDRDYAKARFNMAYVLLRQGHWEEGWRCLEARQDYIQQAHYFTFPRWNGEALAGKSILIGLEAGHGDMIQFCRYAPMLKEMGATRVSIVCHPALKSLFKSLTGVHEVFSYMEDVPQSGWDFWTLPMSLPYFFKTRLDNIPASTHYLTPDEKLVAKWSQLLPQSDLRVGMAWKGSTLFENDADRSLPSLDMLAPLGAINGVHFISLQKGAGEDEALAPPAGLKLQAIASELHDFSDTAAVIANLDLVISVDTAVAHLAGSLGKTCWVLLPDYRTDWRWLTERSDSPWYPQHMRLFRQPAGGNWVPVIDALVDALHEWKKGSVSGHS